MASSFTLTQPVIKTQLISHTEFEHSFVVEPLLPGYGHTIGNSMRRVLLSSIPGCAVTRIRINDITHEYQSVEGVTEDALDIILNLKLIRAKILTNDEKVILNISKKTEGEVTAADFAKNSKIEIVNPELYICYLNKDSSIDIEVEISKGSGYLSVDQISLADNANPQDIYVDALFSPVVNTSIKVEQVRVGDKTNFDRLEVIFHTDKSISAKEVVDFLLTTLIDLFSKINSSFQSTFSHNQKSLPENETSSQNSHSDLEEQINLPAKIKSILEKNNILTNSDLISRVDEVEEFPGINEKAMNTIKDYIKTIS